MDGVDVDALIGRSGNQDAWRHSGLAMLDFGNRPKNCIFCEKTPQEGQFEKGNDKVFAVIKQSCRGI